MNSTSFRNEHRVACKLMGSAFELIVVHPETLRAKALLQMGIDEIQRIEDLLSEFKTDSVTSAINQQAGSGPVVVNSEVFALLERCQRLSKLTQGAFDITVGPLKKMYRFRNNEMQFPEQQLIDQTLQRVGYHQLELNTTQQSAFLTRPQMHLSFAAIGKGYAADRVKQLWLDQGLESGVINASGDLTAFGKGQNGKGWTLGIRHPDDKDQTLFDIPVDHASIATSGDYEQFFIHQHIRYGHNINPKTGWPVQGLKSVSVLSPSAELSDALATAVYVMGIDTGLHLINQLPNTHVILIDAQNATHFSKNIQAAYA
ncbi:MAG: FAD:protein FMN transferase [Bacteroidota bacterium]